MFKCPSTDTNDRANQLALKTGQAEQQLQRLMPIDTPHEAQRRLKIRRTLASQAALSLHLLFLSPFKASQIAPIIPNNVSLPQRRMASSDYSHGLPRPEKAQDRRKHGLAGVAAGTNVSVLIIRIHVESQLHLALIVYGDTNYA